MLPPHVGGAAAAKPAPEIDNRLEEAGTKPAQLPKHAHTHCFTLKTYLKEKDPGHEEGAIHRTHSGDKIIKAANRTLHLN